MGKANGCWVHRSIQWWSYTFASKSIEENFFGVHSCKSSSLHYSTNYIHRPIQTERISRYHRRLMWPPYWYYHDNYHYLCCIQWSLVHIPVESWPCEWLRVVQVHDVHDCWFSTVAYWCCHHDVLHCSWLYSSESWRRMLFKYLNDVYWNL